MPKGFRDQHLLKRFVSEGIVFPELDLPEELRAIALEWLDLLGEELEPLKGKEIDVEVLTAGEYKRTLTMFGENTTKGREKFIEELEDVHTLFKDFVSDNRPAVDVDVVATGEAWYGKRALQHQLVDALQTSDEYIFEKCQKADVYKIKYVEDSNRLDKILDRFTSVFMRLTGRNDLEHQGPYTF